MQHWQVGGWWLALDPLRHIIVPVSASLRPRTTIAAVCFDYKHTQKRRDSQIECLSAPRCTQPLQERRDGIVTTLDSDTTRAEAESESVSSRFPWDADIDANFIASHGIVIGEFLEKHKDTLRTMGGSVSWTSLLACHHLDRRKGRCGPSANRQATTIF